MSKLTKWLSDFQNGSYDPIMLDFVSIILIPSPIYSSSISFSLVLETPKAFVYDRHDRTFFSLHIFGSPTW